MLKEKNKNEILIQNKNSVHIKKTLIARINLSRGTTTFWMISLCDICYPS